MCVFYAEKWELKYILRKTLSLYPCLLIHLLFTRIYFVVVVVLLSQKDLEEKLAEIERRRLVSNWNKFLDLVSKTVCMAITEPCSLWFSIVIFLLFFFKGGKIELWRGDISQTNHDQGKSTTSYGNERRGKEKMTKSGYLGGENPFPSYFQS